MKSHVWPTIIQGRKNGQEHGELVVNSLTSDEKEGVPGAAIRITVAEGEFHGECAMVYLDDASARLLVRDILERLGEVTA